MSADITEQTPEQPEPTPLERPADGVPEVSVSAAQIAAAAEFLAGGHGPFAVDAERASGFRYSNRAYLIQVRRAGAGTVLIDPVGDDIDDPVPVLAPLAEVLGTDEWILHAADQDLPCLAEVGMHPPALYDTELAGRLAGFDRVNLAAMVQRLLGLGLAKGHGAADWSKRPLPDSWLNYAALDVEVLIELRAAIAGVLAEQGKTDWAAQEFDNLLAFDTAAPTRRDRWRRTSGIHKVRDRRGLAAVRELWLVRDQIAQRRDIAPGRILPDSSIVAAAVANPLTIDDLLKLPVFGGPKQRRSAHTWLAALAAARENPNPPETGESYGGPPPPARWAKRKPEAAVRLEAARAALSELSQQVSVPTENLVTPELIRRLCWDWPGGGEQVVEEFLAGGGARPWQRELAVPVLAAVLG